MSSEHEAYAVYRRACERAYRYGMEWSTAARTVIEHYRDPLNELNGFPVPDRDTGSNLAYTLRALTEEFERGMGQILRGTFADYTSEVPLSDPSSSGKGVQVPGLAHLWVCLGEVYERAVVRATRAARGNSGTLLCAWALEAVRTYWDLPGSLARELGGRVGDLPLVRALEDDAARMVKGWEHHSEGVPSGEASRQFEYALAEARAMAYAAERIRATVGESMVPSTMLSVMVELARLDLYYDFEEPAGGSSRRLKRTRRAAILRALERTAQCPPAPHLAGSVDAGALGFYLAVVHSNPGWKGATLGEGQVRRLLTPAVATDGATSVVAESADTVCAGDGVVSGAQITVGGSGGECLRMSSPEGEGESGWELMGTLRCEPLAMAQLRLELEGMGDSLLITPLDVSAGLWAVHVHVPNIAAARTLILSYGEWGDERISSLADGQHRDSSCGEPGEVHV